ncbi:MAG: NUMOD4 domain-containing protein [Minisyncoccia bacterium]
MQTEEIWIDVPEFSEYYQVSNRGRFRSKFWRVGGKFKALEELKLKQNRDGYLLTRFSVEKKQYFRNAHRIVANVFIPNPLGLPYVNHKDLNKQNNSVENLEWCTARENMLHRFSNKPRVGARNVRHILENAGLLEKGRVVRGKQTKEGVIMYRKAYKRAMKLGLI